MKKLLLASVSVVATCSAFAADLPIKVPPSSAFAPAYNWTGFYLGVNGGYGFDLGSFGLGPASAADLAGSPQGFLAGVHGGFGYQSSIFYLGLEGDIDGANITGTGALPGLVTAASKNSWLMSVRARAGLIPVGHALIYGTAGYGWGGGEFTVTDLLGGTARVNPTMTGFVW